MVSKDFSSACVLHTVKHLIEDIFKPAYCLCCNLQGSWTHNISKSVLEPNYNLALNTQNLTGVILTGIPYTKRS